MAIDVEKLRRALALAIEAAPDCAVHLSVHATTQAALNDAAAGCEPHTVEMDEREEFDTLTVGEHSFRDSLGEPRSSHAAIFGPRRLRARGAA